MYTVEQAERWTRRLARSHYENFLVVSWLLPRRLHQPMFNVYAYCRTVDDLGDEAEGDRLALLDDWQGQLEACFQGQAEHPIFVALGKTIRDYDLPIEPFQRLIQANRQDQLVSRYETYADVLDYCQYSATKQFISAAERISGVRISGGVVTDATALPTLSDGRCSRIVQIWAANLDE